MKSVLRTSVLAVVVAGTSVAMAGAPALAAQPPLPSYVAAPSLGSQAKTAAPRTGSTPSVRPSIPNAPTKPGSVNAKVVTTSAKPLSLGTTKSGAGSKSAVTNTSKPTLGGPESLPRVVAAPTILAAKDKSSKSKTPSKGGTAVPEFDGKSTGAAIALLLGGMLVMVDRRRRSDVASLQV